jgi:PhnB protein
MVTLASYLFLPGNTEEAFSFYKSVFGGEILGIQRYKDIFKGDKRLSKKDENKVQHMALKIGKDDILMGTDFLESFQGKLVRGNDYVISVFPDSKEEAQKLFKDLSAGGEVEMPMDDHPWGGYDGNCKDKFGVRWTVYYYNTEAK